MRKTTLLTLSSAALAAFFLPACGAEPAESAPGTPSATVAGETGAAAAVATSAQATWIVYTLPG